MSALSDSTTRSMSPTSTLSPTFISHCEILPSVIVDDSAGIITCALSTSSAGAAAAAGAGSAAAAGAGAAAAGAPPPAWTSAMSASFSTSSATGAPTAAVSPSGTRILAMKPSSYDSTSMSALSDSTTRSMSPASTLSPSFISHCEILPSVIVDDSAGIITSVVSAITTSGALRAARTAGWGCATAERYAPAPAAWYATVGATAAARTILDIILAAVVSGCLRAVSTESSWTSRLDLQSASEWDAERC